MLVRRDKWEEKFGPLPQGIAVITLGSHLSYGKKVEDQLNLFPPIPDEFVQVRANNKLL